ncbi:Transcriptional regulator GlxA family, contains an amidase domain and an AraC-type DNA-binding HTH domain [Promicromonospora umidemergens]|uniref:DJ-1/PfpI family protein n=1 Tax=Promicromonospora umidemergens TaxID=629679 RepID=A0ABP8YBD0_9MICO|nr:DJ-1/PfpI family protein [Promicromonospora umidemergens]MCP2282371.1 Transcriptional regulator GlxA family, contains an amidase domain and an AraC-type DNA-binding HTH domain [Promicromonospora umidemergens]
MTTVVFVLLPGVHLLDLAGPAQAFFTAGDLGRPYDLRYVSGAPAGDHPGSDAGVVASAQGLPLVASTDWPELGPDDLVVVPGWRVGSDPAAWPLVSEPVRERLRWHHAGGGTVASVCAGADALGQAGLLDGRRCTTHHAVQDDLAARHPLAHVVRDVLFTTDDGVVTSAGIASGIDLSLHLLAVRHGPALAARVAREMVVYARRNGTEPQASAMLRHRAHVDDTVHRVQNHIDTHFARALPLADLARHAGVAERTLTRLFTRAAGVTPLRYQQLLRLERAEHLIGHGATVESAARTVGFQDARMLRRLRNTPHLVR